jgi:putative tricarboxylic transport membrane protein
MSDPAGHPRGPALRSPQDVAGGALLLAIAAIALWLSADLPAGSLRQLGPGMFPRALAVLTGLAGAAILLDAFLQDGPAFERWQFRAPVFILGAAVAFGFAVRPLGLLIAAPLVMVIGAYASPETRWREVLIFGGVMTVFCVALFKFALGLPIPVAPWLIGY